jgi:Tfp pilus assembly protein PilN
MRPVNLLPARYRPRTGASGDSKSAYMALGALGLVVLAVFGYVFSASKVGSNAAEIAKTRQQIQDAEAQAVTLKGFGDFAGVKQARLASVKSLASERLDWERLFRELAHVLPSGVWLTNFSGTAAGAEGGADVESALVLTGCAESHEKIADVMVRLREIHIAEDVELSKTTAGAKAEQVQGAAPAAAPAAGDSEAGCGSDITFDIKVTIATTPEVATGEPGTAVPARLGGGQ